jgi:hypothetical protein
MCRDIYFQKPGQIRRFTYRDDSYLYYIQEVRQVLQAQVIKCLQQTCVVVVNVSHTKKDNLDHGLVFGTLVGVHIHVRDGHEQLHNIQNSCSSFHPTSLILAWLRDTFIYRPRMLQVAQHAAWPFSQLKHTF